MVKLPGMLNPLDENGNPKTDPLNPDKSYNQDLEWV